MKHAICVATVLVAAISFATRVDANAKLWSELEPTKLPSVSERFVPVDAGRMLRLDHPGITTLLQGAPSEKTVRVPDSDRTLDLPLPEGGFATFRVVETPVMAPELAARYPMIKTYLAQRVDEPGTTARLDLTSAGFRAQISTGSRTAYIEPLAKGDSTRYVAFNKADDTSERPPMRCAVTGEVFKSLPESLRKGSTTALATGANLRTYRLAAAATAEYTAVFGGKAEALGAIVTTMNRVNGIFEREASVRMVLVANTDLVIYTNAATDPYSNNDSAAMLGQNQTTLTNVIGSANYDIGHVFTTGGGGVASLGSVCSPSRKAQGVTGLPSPRGDWYDVDFVSHEMGHQFAATHTFNSTSNNCNGNRSEGSAYEPGSGMSIMGYVGSCAPHNLQRDSDDVFHRGSLDQIHDFVAARGGSTCGTLTSTGNTPPTVTVPAGSYSIPLNTPFALTAAGSDANGDALTYSWEQLDKGDAAYPNVAPVSPDPLTFDDQGGGPLFRSYSPTTSNTRLFPSLRYILNNANIVPVEAPLPGTTTPLFYAGERMPSWNQNNRTLNFQVTVRDNRAGGGGTNNAGVAVTTIAGTGPFAVTAPNTAVSWAAGSTQTVNWNVAGTTGSPISTSQVQIALSTDGGITFPTILASAVANNGSASVTIPAGTPATQRARIRVSAVGNIFFDISDANFTITGSNGVPSITATTNTLTVTQGGAAVSAVLATVSDPQDAAGTLTVTIVEAAPELTVSVANNAGNVSVTASAACTIYAPNSGFQVYPVTLRVTDAAGATATETVYVRVSANAVPVLGTYSNLVLSRGTSATAIANAAISDANGNANPPTISVTNLPGSGAGGSVTLAANGNVSITTTATTTEGTFPIRVSVNDSCGATRTREFSVRVIPAGSFVEPTANQLLTGNARIEPNECNELSVTLANIGNAAATSLNAQLTTNTPGVNIVRPAAAFGNLGNGQSLATPTPFQFSTTNALACGTNVNFTLGLTYGGGNAPVSFPLSFIVGAPSTFFTERFDGVTAPALPAGWSSAVTGTTPPAAWATTTSSPASTLNAVATDGVPSVATNTLVSAPITLPASNTGGALRFSHRWNFESGYDGGVLEISTNGGTSFVDVTAPSIGASFEASGYVGPIDTRFESPIAGRQAWTGTQSSYVTTVVRLPASLNGQTVQFRWVAAWDNEANNAGINWRIDDVQVDSGLVCPNAGTGACAAPTYTISGTVSGLTGTGLVLQNNGGDNRTISANGSFTFTTPQQSGTNYLVSVLTQPTSPSQSCAVSNGAGTVNGANVSNVTVTCATNAFAIATAAQPTAGGTVVCTPNPVPSGNAATCSATPALGFAFVNWSGDCAGSACSFASVTSNRSVTATFVALPLLNIDGSDAATAYDAATDGVLLMRYLLGMRGAELIANARGAGASLRDATQIENHIATYLARFDVDGDGFVRPHTDGVLIYRRLLGLSGTALTSGVKFSNRTDLEVQNAIDALKP